MFNSNKDGPLNCYKASSRNIIAIQVQPLGRSISAHKGQGLSEALAQSGICIEHPCGDHGKCGAVKYWWTPE